MESKKARSMFGIVIAITIALLLVFVVYLLAFSTVTVEGVVDHKAITGIANQTQYTLVMITPWEIQILGASVSDLFQGKGLNLTVNEEFEQELLNRGYSEIGYQASIRVSSKDPVNHLEPGDTMGYLVKRSDFNVLPMGASVEFEVEKGKSLWITDVHD